MDTGGIEIIVMELLPQKEIFFVAPAFIYSSHAPAWEL